MLKKLRLFLSVVLVMIGVSATQLQAQDAPAAAPPAAEAADTVVKQPGFTDIVFGGGAVNVLIWCLIFLASFATIAFIFDGAVTTRRDKILPGNLVAGVRASLDDGDLGAAMANCEHNPGPLSNILMTGFSNISDGYEVVQEAVGAATDLESEKIMQRINYLNLCGQIAPMLGLLGTVTGMVKAFSSLAEVQGSAKDMLLAQAISGALWTTVAGLLISVPALLAFTVYKNMAIRVLLESEATVLDLIKILRNAEVDDGDDDDFE